jgi:hypothetical protein
VIVVGFGGVWFLVWLFGFGGVWFWFVWFGFGDGCLVLFESSYVG